MIKQHGYKYSFNPNKCDECGGKCCYGESGYIFVSIDEIMAIATFLGMSVEEFCMKYVKRVDNIRFSLIEKKCKDKSKGMSCIFFDENTNKCSIYQVRPQQCISFPFWEQYKGKTDSIKSRCIGICVTNE